MYSKINTVAAVAALMLAGGAFADDTQGRGVPGVDVNVDLKMPMVDKNSDGKVTRSEAASNPELSRQFDTLDSNKDGSLDKGEFAKFQAKGKGVIGNDSGDEAPNKNNTPGTTDDSTPGNKDKLGPGR